MKIKHVFGTILAAGVLTVSYVAQAHLTYTGRDFGSYSGLTNGTFSITNQTCTGNYGWADAADGVLGDTHKGRAFKFHLNNAALVTLTVSANPSATGTSLGGLTPAYSIYSGLAHIAPYPATQTALPPSADYDFSTASMVWRAAWEQANIGGDGTTNALATDGCWNALGVWKMGGDGALPGDFSQLSTFTYVGSASSTTSGGTVAKSFALTAGDYTIMIGGNDISNKTAGTAASGFGISATLAVSPTPALNIAQKVFVNWPTGTATNWVLQASTNVNGPMWSSVTNSPLTVDGQPGVVLDRNASQQFFRLNYVP
jgi:hypothetical protein